MSEKFDEIGKFLNQLGDRIDAYQESLENGLEELEETIESKNDHIEELESQRMDYDDDLNILRMEQVDLIRAQGNLEDLLSRYDELKKTEKKALDDVEELIKLSNIIIRQAKALKLQLQDMWDVYQTGLETIED